MRLLPLALAVVSVAASELPPMPSIQWTEDCLCARIQEYIDTYYPLNSSIPGRELQHAGSCTGFNIQLSVFCDCSVCPLNEPPKSNCGIQKKIFYVGFPAVIISTISLCLIRRFTIAWYGRRSMARVAIQFLGGTVCFVLSMVLFGWLGASVGHCHTRSAYVLLPVLLLIKSILWCGIGCYVYRVGGSPLIGR